jgi:hypothetical protein
MGNDPAYVARYRAIYPLAELARRLSTECGQSLLKVIALGPGDGNLEVRFVQLLLDEMTKPDIELVLFDISQPLLNTAYQHALDTFGEQSPVHTLMLQGNFPGSGPLSPGQLRARERSAAADLHDVGKHARQPRQRAALLQALYVALPAGGLLGA